MIKINVVTADLNWQRYIQNPSSFINNKIKFFNKKNKNFKKNIIICTLLLAGNKEIKKLNKKIRKKNKTTDVLSFPFYEKKELLRRLKKEKEIYLGDIIVNLSKIRNKIIIAKFKSEFNSLWVHGLVHLFGYDQKKKKDFKKMSLVEKNFLKYIK